MPHCPPTWNADAWESAPGRLGKPGAPDSAWRLPAWRHHDEVVAVMAGISTTILLGLTALGEPFCLSPFASGSPHVPGPGYAILVLAAIAFWLAAGESGEPAGAVKQNGSPIICTLRESLIPEFPSSSRTASLHFSTD
jgi:hypothetical protein